MIDRPITIAGLPTPTDDPTFLAILAIHVVAGRGLFVLGGLSLTFAVGGRRLINGASRYRVRAHLVAMGISYLLLIIAFYIDNGRAPPVWKDLPPALYWGLPVAFGVPLILRALRSHRLARLERARDGGPRA